MSSIIYIKNTIYSVSVYIIHRCGMELFSEGWNRW